MASLKTEHQEFIVLRLARWEPIREVQEALKAEYGIELAPNQIAYYDPTNAAGAKLSQHWKTLFQQTRDAYIAAEEDVDIAHRSVRLRLYRAMLEDKVVKRSVALQLQVLKQIAQERGGQFQQKESAGASPDEVAAYVGAAISKMIATVLSHVKDPAEKERILAALEAENDMAGSGKNGHRGGAPAGA